MENLTKNRLFYEKGNLRPIILLITGIVCIAGSFITDSLIYLAPLNVSAANTSSSGFEAITVCGDNTGYYADKFQNVRSVNSSAYFATAGQYFKDPRTCHLADIFRLVARLTNVLIAFAGIFAAFRLVLAGAQMVGGAGNEDMAKAGKKAMSHAILGLVLVLVAYLVVNTIFAIFAVQLHVTPAFQFPYNPLQ